jgi:hypothetical protein
MKNNKTFLILVYLAIGSIALLGSKCKKDKEPPPEEKPDVITCTSNITDGCLDDWKTFTWEYSYINPTGEFLQSLNELAGLPPEAGGPGPVTCDTVTDCMQGRLAAKLTSKSFTVLTTPIFIPGYIGTSVLNITKRNIFLGKPYTQRPQRFHAYYKYSPAGGDSALIQVVLTKYASGVRDTISFDKIIQKNPVSSYLLLDLPLSYRDTVSSPDTLVIVFSASAGINFNDVFHCTGQVGSVMWVDDLKFIFP